MTCGRLSVNGCKVVVVCLSSLRRRPNSLTLLFSLHFAHTDQKNATYLYTFRAVELSVKSFTHFLVHSVDTLSHSITRPWFPTVVDSHHCSIADWAEWEDHTVDTLHIYINMQYAPSVSPSFGLYYSSIDNYMSCSPVYRAAVNRTGSWYEKYLSSELLPVLVNNWLLTELHSVSCLSSCKLELYSNIKLLTLTIVFLPRSIRDHFVLLLAQKYRGYRLISRIYLIWNNECS